MGKFAGVFNNCTLTNFVAKVKRNLSVIFWLLTIVLLSGYITHKTEIRYIIVLEGADFHTCFYVTICCFALI